MFQHVFAEMNNMLDVIVKHYPTAHDAERQQLIQQYNLLKGMSEGIIEEWLSFEEKMSSFREQSAMPPLFPLSEMSVLQMEPFIRGQGYYKLFMYAQAVEQFDRVIHAYPDSMLARMYIAMAELHLENMKEAQLHFQWLLPHAEHGKLRAMIYNALGCIQAKGGDSGKAQEYFTLALQSDPTLPDPLINLQVCHQNSGQLQYGSQLITLM